jgi:hypothetical protein
VLNATLKDTLAGLDGLMGRIEASLRWSIVLMTPALDTGALDWPSPGGGGASSVDRDARRDRRRVRTRAARAHVATLRTATIARVKVRALEARGDPAHRRIHPAAPAGAAAGRPAGSLPGGMGSRPSSRREAGGALATHRCARPLGRYHLRSPSYHN